MPGLGFRDEQAGGKVETGRPHPVWEREAMEHFASVLMCLDSWGFALMGRAMRLQCPAGWRRGAGW